MRKPNFYICEKLSRRPAVQLLISTFVFTSLTSKIVQFVYLLNPKFQASSLFLLQYRPVCVGPAWTPEDRFSSDTAHIIYVYTLSCPS